MRTFFKIGYQSILSGLLIGVGGCVYLSINPIIGAFLFSLGLLTILNFKLPLYTGRIGFLFEEQRKENKQVVLYVHNGNTICANQRVSLIEKIAHLVLMWSGNMLGTYLAATAFLNTRIGPKLIETVTPIVETKLNDSFISLFLLSVGCGALMYIAAAGYKIYAYKESGSDIVGNIFAIIPIAVFILCGFEHCIADMFYMFLYGEVDFIRLLIITLGNTLGSFLINFLKK